jgi:hypothetical protein|tara:strand:- start:3287 stop:3586 length:300 start_codon:yes stop_codon:yes gene_type:complete
MKTNKNTKRTLFIIFLTFFIGGMCQAQTNYLEELGIQVEEYKDIQKHADDPLRIPITRILTNKEVVFPKMEIIDKNCIVKPWIIPMLPLNIIKKEEEEK